MEREVKYLVQDMDDFERRLCERYPAIQYMGIIDLPAIYYDTADGRLERSKTALRVREEGGRLVGCYKATTGEERVFVEEEIELREEDLSHEWFKKLEHYCELAQKVEEARLYPVVKITTERKVYVLATDTMTVEIALDRIDYLEGAAIEERIEVEWKDGNVTFFEAFLHKFEMDIGELQETHMSKYQRAKELLRGRA